MRVSGALVASDRGHCGRDPDVAKIRRRHGEREYVSHLVRRSVREAKRVRHETITNVSKLPVEAIEALALALRGVRLLPAGEALRRTKAGRP